MSRSDTTRGPDAPVPLKSNRNLRFHFKLPVRDPVGP